MMTTKFFLLAFLALLSFSGLAAQGQFDPAIQGKLDAFIEFTNQKQWPEAFELVYPKLFTKVAKQDLIDLMAGMESDGLEISLANTKITTVSAPVSEGKETFVRIEYQSDMSIHLRPGSIYDAPKAIQALEEQFKLSYGQSNVVWDNKDKVFHINANRAMMGVDPGDGDWKLVEINMDQPDLMAYLFSPSVIDALVHNK